MAEVYRTLRGEGRDEFVVSRSRFIGWSAPAPEEETALAFIEKVRKDNWDASHNVWAYVVGASRERYSDDGEPQGTAGLPVLDVIRKEGLRDAVVVVTRYFGGVKLGAGGLVRAYTQGARIALAAGRPVRRLPYLSFSLDTDYALAGRYQREFGKRGYVVKHIRWLDKASIAVLVPPEEKAALRELAAALSGGRDVPLPGPEEYIDEEE
ncbi:MAG: YigZ family protein [Clostridiales bacterium]|nr:YigZ family protein [Clostridiales bacterium]